MGLLDNINSGLQGAMQSPLFALGTGLIAGAQPGANPGQALQSAAANQQAMQMQGYQLQMMQQQLPMYLGILSRLGAMMGAPQKGKGQKQQPTQQATSAPIAGPYSPAPTAQGLPGAAQGVAPPQGLMGGPVAGASPMGLMNAGILASAVPLTAPLGKALMQGAQFQAQYDPALATQLAAAKSAVAQDQALLTAAQQSGAPASTIQGLQTKLATDLGQLHIGSMSGILTRQLPNGSWTTTDPRTGLATNTVSGSTLMPGAAQAQRAMAAAHAVGEAAGEVNDVGGVPVPRSQILGLQAGGPAQSGALPGANPLLSLLRQGTLAKEVGEQGGEQIKTYQEAADSARNANYALDQMMQDAKQVSLGPASGIKEWGMKVTGGIGQMFGVSPPKQLSSYQELDKYANQVAFAATRQMGSREAAQIVHLQMQSNPNKELTATAFTDLAGSMKAMNNYIMAKSVAIQQAAQANGGDVPLAASKWTQSVDPRVWDLTLSPAMGEKWASSVGKAKIESAWQYLTPDEQQSLVQNIPMAVRKQWLASSKP